VLYLRDRLSSRFFHCSSFLRIRLVLLVGLDSAKRAGVLARNPTSSFSNSVAFGLCLVVDLGLFYQFNFYPLSSLMFYFGSHVYHSIS
jgi:hypothetical protein